MTTQVPQEELAPEFSPRSAVLWAYVLVTVVGIKTRETWAKIGMQVPNLCK